MSFLPVEIFTGDHRQVTLNRPAYVPVRVPELSNGKSLDLTDVAQETVNAESNNDFERRVPLPAKKD
jgi:hypothetical protein